jgi:hypothetical protein
VCFIHFVYVVHAGKCYGGSVRSYLAAGAPAVSGVAGRIERKSMLN